MAESTADVVKTKEYVKLRMTLAETMDTDLARSYAEGFGLITANQEDKLRTAHEPKGMMGHNRELFRMMEVGGLQALRTFADDVLKKLGPQFAESRAELMRLCGVGPASTSTNPAVSGADASPAVAENAEEREANPWKHTRFIGSTASLIKKLTSIGRVRSLCFSNGLIDDEANEKLSHLQPKSAHNVELILILQQSSHGSFAKFREVIRHMDSTNVFTEILRKWDSIGPSPELPEYQKLRKEFLSE